jgi:hypothetical protein
MLFRSRKSLPDSENVPEGSALAIVPSNPLHFTDDKTKTQREKRTCSGLIYELVAEMEPEPRSILGPQSTVI